MRNFAIGALVGAVVGISSAAWLIQARFDEKFAEGHAHGRTSGMVDAAHKIRAAFGEYDPAEGPSDLVYSVKDVDVIAVTVDGKKTIRVR